MLLLFWFGPIETNGLVMTISWYRDIDVAIVVVPIMGYAASILIYLYVLQVFEDTYSVYYAPL